MNSEDSKIFSLANEALSGVAFVQDYVEFHFDGKILRALVGPVVSSGAGTFVFPGYGTRDAFCSLIGRIVERVSVHEKIAIELTFSDGVVLRIPLIQSGTSGPEMAHFVPGENQPIEVW